MSAQDLNTSIFNHLFLPYDLPTSADADYLLQYKHRNEHKFLESFNEFLRSSASEKTLPVFSILKNCFENWLAIQNIENCTISNLQSTIKKLTPGDFLPLYFHAQNAAILIEVDENPLQPLISSWQVLLPTEMVTSSLQPYLCHHSTPTFRLSDISQVTSSIECELLVEFMTNTIEYPKSSKAFYSFDETREVPSSHYVCQWWITHFPEIKNENLDNTSIQFKKKYREQIRCKSSYSTSPFRRSGLWMTMKVVLQTILIKRLGKIGNIVYKLLNTSFLIYFVYMRQTLKDIQLSNDLLVYCLRKIARRLTKIENMSLATDSNDVKQWIEMIMKQIKNKIEIIFPKSDWQNHIYVNDKQINQFNRNQSEIYEHSCTKLKEYLKKRSQVLSSSYRSFSRDYNSVKLVSTSIQHEANKLPFVTALSNSKNKTINFALTRIEIWVKNYLEQWIDYAFASDNRSKHLEDLQKFFEDYQQTALKQYYSDNKFTDPIGYSRYILTSLTIIRFIHMKLCKDQRFEQLKFHAIKIPNLLELFEYLILPSRDEMILARTLYDYFQEYSTKQYPELLSHIDSKNAFGVYFAERSEQMVKVLTEIQAQVEQDKNAKRQEVIEEKAKYDELMKQAVELICECETEYPYKKCDRCKMVQKANNMKVEIYECPIPSRRESALAVIFELQMPIEIRCYRDILWQFINRPTLVPSNHMHEWLSISPHCGKLSIYNTGSYNRKVKLVSSTKSISQTHYFAPRSVSSTPLEDFLLENSLHVQISPTKPSTFQDECLTLTPQLTDANYRLLQFSVDSTKFVQNHVIAQLSNCSVSMKPSQFVEFGSFRSGHRLQWWNLLSIIELDSLPMNEESVAILITHSLWQYGPMTNDREDLICYWCPESHQQLLDDDFVDELIIRIDHRLDECKCNWQHELVLVILTIIVMRILTICNSTKKTQMIDLALKCRKTAEKWIELISENIHNPSSLECDKIETLRDKLKIIGQAGLLTFSLHIDNIDRMPLSNEHVVCLLKLGTTVQDNLILRKEQIDVNVFMRNLKRFSERNLLLLQPILNQFLQNTSYESLNKFTAEYWAVNKRRNTTNGKWIKRDTDIYDGRYSAQYGSNQVSINCIRGIFSVDKVTIGFLPDKITSNELFIGFFEKQIFEVQPSDTKDTYITKHGYHTDRKVHYEFNYNDSSRRLTIQERHNQTNERFELIPSNCFEKELPDVFISNYNHWMNVNTEEIEFRATRFQDPNFLTDKHYTLAIKTGLITIKNMETIQILINQSSSLFKSLFERYFIRLDDAPYVYMLRDITEKNTEPQFSHIIHIHLSRLGIAFRYDTHRDLIISREYPDMYINKNQNFGTLTGLNVGLLLLPMTVTYQKNKYSLCRKLIIPYGHAKVKKTLDKIHQTVTIERKVLPRTSLNQYFVFTLNDRLHILQSTDSPTGWLYLALLHAITSNSLPDRYTGMTGMERAFQLLNSAGSWSDQPYDPISLNILSQIATLSPKVNYYPENQTCMIKIDWNNQDLPYSIQHFGYYLLAKKLYEASEQWKFMYPTNISSEIQKLFENKEYNEKVLIKLYWDYRDSYNPTARLSHQMEVEIQSTYVTKSYQPIWESSTLSTYYNNPLQLVNGLYSSGDVYLTDSLSSLTCFPLSRWLTGSYHPKQIWISLFKSIEQLKTESTPNQQYETERLEILLDFLRYISRKHDTQPFYFQLLKSILKSSIKTLRTLPYPEFTHYTNIQETSVQSHRIDFPRKLYPCNREKALQEIRRCFINNLEYTNETFPTWNINTHQSRRLFASWRANGVLRSFLDNIQSHIQSITIIPLNTDVNVSPQSFSTESFESHYQIRINSQNSSIDQNLLEYAKQKFLHSHSDYFIEPTTVTEIINEQQKAFPKEIMPSADLQLNPLSEIANHFKEYLTESWTKFQEIKEYQRKYPDLNKINDFLKASCEQSTQFWNQLTNSIKLNNELLFKTGLMIRILPTTLISILLQTNTDNLSSLSLTTDQCTLLGGLLVNCVVEQQTERALYLANNMKWEDFEKEISNIPHTNWIPADHISWLIMEIEMNITIRKIQIQVARHMMNPKITEDNSSIRNIVMQMNMGEGKTSVILPMLALSLSSSSSSLVRLIVLKSLFTMNYQSLRCKLGGLLNRRILPFSCRRDMNFTIEQVNLIFNRLQQGLKYCDVIITSPEDILSFDLLTIDKCRRNEFNIGQSMLLIQQWCKIYIRDILDESDEILHVKYQLIYSVGHQQQVDGGAERWKTIQSILASVKQHAATIAHQYEDDVFYKASTRKSHFPEFRLLSHEPFTSLCELILKEWLKSRSFRPNDLQIIESFILNKNSSIDDVTSQFSDTIIQLFLILRGLLSSEVLLVALKRRYRVNFGVNESSKFNRLMAVPFRAKDVAAENTEFGHPDVAIILTQLSYYYSGLNDKQMLQCFNRMNEEEKDPDVIYEEWISQEDKHNGWISNIQHWKLINLKNYQQRTEYLFPNLRHNILVINYFLNHFVFPREAKQFPYKLVSSSWDLSSSLSRHQIITGFSGTNDTQLLLPTHIHQCDLPELRKTDALVLNNLLRSENENYQCLPISASSEEILKQIVNCQLNIQVILDVGALFIDGTNHQIAIKWLNLLDKNKIDYAVYFESNEVFVSDRLSRCHAFSTSPASERLDRCIFFLDEIHTRGTDFKFPNDFRAAVTLGNGLTKDRLVQACMRMRKLGKCHWLSFWSSLEVHHQIEILKKNSLSLGQQENYNEQVTLVDILRWVYENTQQATWDGLHHWATQSLSFQRKVTAFQNINQNTNQVTYTNTMMEQLAKDCLENETLDLKSMYGSSKIWQTIWEIYSVRHKYFQICSSTDIHKAVSKRLQDYCGSKKLLSQLLDEEQQRELEQEQEMEEERQQKRLPVVQPYEPVLHNEIKSLCDMQGPIMNLSKLTTVFRPLKDAFLGTTFHQHTQFHCWQENLWISTEFQRVIQTQGESLDSFLRPLRWILFYRNEHIIFISAYEANWLLGQLQALYNKQKFEKSAMTTLRLILPRLQRDQSIFIDIPRLTIPSRAYLPIPTQWLTQLFVFNGTLYFNTVEEQTAYCQCLGLCPKPRTKLEDDAFDNGWIALDGYVEQLKHRKQLQMHHCCFPPNPLAFVKKLLENRNSSHAPLTSHVGSIIFNGVKLEIS
ncbi:unnamed protein product [Adineta steineri]|uniref:ubiquitinyl hydrolase 1 n=1 Tax=Adineta steineri TaxID=433720 RepID=A0A819C9H0_9BILA|nr:unnamed protein product [Adineta steineri]CAF1470111.1 unnamed protein product [Adineta steineri]CAF3804158.1 unnamed protein product [Adineta steineri]CAF3841657.1 unnamed protein product [Adineta steineri]